MKDMLVMRDGRALRWGVIAAALVGGVLAQSVQAQCQYDVTIIQAPDCPWPFPPPATVGTGINDLGHMVGYYTQCGGAEGNEAFLWTPEEGLITLERPSGANSAEARDINNPGQIAGYFFDVPGENLGALAVVWDGNDLVEILPPSGGTFSQADGINNQGQVVGTTADGKTPYFKGFLWENGEMSLLEPTFGPRSSASDINDLGKITGWMGSSGSDWHAFLREDGLVTDLGVIPGGFTSQASGINNLAETVGWGQLQDPKGDGNVTHAFFWNSDEMIDIGTLPGFRRSFALGINDDSTAVGFCRDFGGNPNIQRAFVWCQGMMTDLNDLIPADLGLFIKRAEAINNAGQITGWGSGASGHDVAVLFTPVVFPLGDLNGDCRVNAWDLALLLGSWGPCAGCPADLNGDGEVGAGDLAALLGGWG